jgi:hypothetical protein
VTKSAETICTVTCVSGDYNNDLTHSSSYSSSPPQSNRTQVLGGLKNEGRKRYKDKRRRERNGKKGQEDETKKKIEKAGESKKRGVSYRYCVGNLSPAMGARNQVGIGLSYRPARLCSLATQFQTRFLESIPRPIAELKFSTLCR